MGNKAKTRKMGNWGILFSKEKKVFKSRELEFQLGQRVPQRERDCGGIKFRERAFTLGVFGGKHFSFGGEKKTLFWGGA